MVQKKKTTKVSEEPTKNFKTKKELIVEIVKRKTKEKFLSESQKKYYELLYNYNVFWMFNPTEKSRNEAESKGLFFKKENSELAFYVSRFNFFLKDYKSLDDLMITQAKICGFELIPHISDPNVYPDVNKRERIDPKKLGVPNYDPSSILRLKYLIGNMKDEINFYKLDIDSLTYYANKAIVVIEKSK